MGEVFPQLSPEILERVRAIHDGQPRNWTPVTFSVPLEERELSLREIDVLALVADGLTDREIGGRLAITTATVKTHVKHILVKTGATRRAEAVAYGFRNGILT